MSVKPAALLGGFGEAKPRATDGEGPRAADGMERRAMKGKAVMVVAAEGAKGLVQAGPAASLA